MPPRVEMLEKMVAAMPADPFPYYCLAQEYRGANRTDDALAAFQLLRERFPDYVPQYLMAAQTCQTAGRFDEARTWATTGIAVAEKKRDAHSAGELEGLLASLP